MNIVKDLFSIACKTRLHAYAPYSDFKVGVAIYADDCEIYTGCNVENISYPCGTCAESGAIAEMIAHGGKQIKEILIVADTDELITPCGACRQKIAEFATPQTLVHLATLDGVKKTLTLQDLFPLGFANGELKNDRKDC